MPRVCFIILSLLLLCGLRAGAQKLPLMSPNPGRVLTNDEYDTIGTAAFTMWFGSNGSLAHNPYTDGSGFEWPKGSGKHVGFYAGLVFGCLYSGEIRVGGSTYRQGLQAGPIDVIGSPTDPADPANRIYAVRRIGAGQYATLPPQEQQRLRTDFLEWPVALGAPWLDRNQNGRYDPAFESWLADSASSDAPRFFGNHMAFFVSNDMDETRSTMLYGTAPIGMEIRTLIWAGSDDPQLENVVFVKHTLINRSRYSYDDMYIGRWGDPDLGSAIDDLAGCDTARAMMYVYNGRRVDGEYGDPPAFGTVLVQGPVIHSLGDTALWNFGRRDNARNLSMTAFTYYVGGDPQYRDPQLGVAAGSFQMYSSLQGRLYDGSLPVDPATGRQSTLCLTGDPVTRSGWLDGIRFMMGDRRIVMGSGPITMAPGDTQEVVFADIVAQGPSTGRDILALRAAAEQARAQYSLLDLGTVRPELVAAVAYPDTHTVSIRVSGRIPRATDATMLLLKHDGSTWARVSVRDDGLSNDGAANDGIFGAIWVGTRQAFGVDCAVAATYPASSLRWSVARCLPLAGPLRILDAPVRSDHLNFDGHANPGENVRVGISVKNTTAFDIDMLEILDDGFLPGTHPWMTLKHTLAPAGSHTIPYDARDSSSFATVDIPPGMSGGQYTILPFQLRDTANQCWCDSARLLVEDFVETPVDSLMIHTAGNATGTLGWRIVDRALLQDHSYRITVRESDRMLTQRFVTIFDMTAWREVVTDAPLPDRFGHLMPQSDGWRLHAGTTSDSPLYGDETAPDVRLLRSSSESNRWLEMAIDVSTGTEWGWGSTVKWQQQRPMRIIFDSSNPQKAYMYLRTGNPNYAYSGYYSVPFTVWDVADTLHPRQVNAAFVEQNNGPRRNNTWDPVAQSDREYIFAFSSSYTETPQKPYTDIPIFPDGASTFDIQYAAWMWRDSTAGPLPRGFAIDIVPIIPVSSADTFFVNPKGRVNGIEVRRRDLRLEIGSPYPNPISRGTSVQLPVTSDSPLRIVIAVYDALGRRVAPALTAEVREGRSMITVPQTAQLRGGVYHIVVEDGAGERRGIPLIVHP